MKNAKIQIFKREHGNIEICINGQPGAEINFNNLKTNKSITFNIVDRQLIEQETDPIFEFIEQRR